MSAPVDEAIDDFDGGRGLVDDVARYYDANTARFLLVGAGRGTYAIHRELWAPGVRSAAEAVDHVNRLMAGEIARRVPAPGSILDLGCGVGGTMFRLAAAFPDASLVGVTISPVQARTGRSLAGRLGLAARCRFVRGSFGAPEVGSGHAAAVAVEAYAHVHDPRAFFEPAAAALEAGAPLVVVDDFLASPLVDLADEERRGAEAVRRGWRVPSLDTVDHAAGAADRAGFDLAEDRDLTGLVRLGRPRDRVIAMLVPAFRALRLGRVPFFGNMIGGHALQRGLGGGSIRYRMLVFTKR